MKPYRHTPEMIARYTEQGYWGGATYSELWDRNAQDYPDLEAIVDSKGGRMTWAQAKIFYDRIALGFMELGYLKDDVIVFQLPNIIETQLLRIACQKAGVLCLPLTMGLRQAEMEYICGIVDARGIIILPKAGERNYLQEIEEIRRNLSKLEHIFAVGEEAFSNTISIRELSSRPLEKRYPPDHFEKTRIGPYEVSALTISSGTTGVPKISEEFNYPQQFAYTNIECWQSPPHEIWGLFTYIGSGLSIPIWFAHLYLPAKLILLEKFDAEEALRLIERERIAFAVGVPAQIEMIVKHPNLGKYNLDCLRAFFYGGAILPHATAKEAEEKLGCKIVGNMGAMDFGPISVLSYDDPQEVRWNSIGKLYPGNELKIVNEEGEEVPQGEMGELLVRGPYAMTGIWKDPEITLKNWGGEKDGWFATGDLVKIDKDGNIYVTGRKKDIISRAAQKISPAEIEDLLLTHADVQSVAVVPMPDPVLGEKACAFVTLKRDAMAFNFEEMVSFLKRKKIASFKLPERLEIIDKLPMSADGQKILKRELTEQVTKKLKAEGKIPF